MNHFQRYLVDEFAEDYQHRRLSRRDALKLIASITGSLLTANTILAACAPSPEETETSIPTSTVAPSSEATATSEAASSTPEQAASAQEAGTVMPDDPQVVAGELQFPAGGDTLLGYLSRPAGNESSPVVLVCHENRGLTPHIQDITRRFAKAGYVALAVDLLSRQGGTNAVGSANVPGALGNIDPDQFVQDFRSGWGYLKTQGFAQAERVGMNGYCFGGGVTWQVATKMPELLAAVPFYGPHPSIDDVPNIQAAILAIYGGLDTRINQGIPAIEAAMQKNNKTYEKVIYPDADHAFNNDTSPRYKPEAAKDVWKRMLAWFEKYLKA
jgi:carboxymethylenebutenolidase